MGFLLRLYVNALLKGNPVALIPTAMVAGVVGFARLSEGLAKRDPVAIGVIAILTLMFLVLLVVGIVDRKLNPDTRKTIRPKQKSGTGASTRTGRR